MGCTVLRVVVTRCSRTIFYSQITRSTRRVDVLAGRAPLT
jgi:hypothetical protein